MSAPYHFARTRVKICGFTNPVQAMKAAALGVDAVGLVFYPPSSRFVTSEAAQEILAALPAFVTTVALFVDPAKEDVETILNSMPIDLIQFHGTEPANFCESFNRPYIKAVRMHESVDLYAIVREHRAAKGILLDAYNPGQMGGTGETFDWARIPNNLSIPIILAGGLSPVNVRLALESIGPFAIDVSSGVEADKGVKDPVKMAEFIKEVKRFDQKY